MAMGMAFSFSSTCSQLRPLQRQLQLRRRRRKHCSQVMLATARLSEDIKAAAATTKTRYRDNWFDLLAINYLSQSVQATTGLRNSKSGYESLVDAAMATSRKFDPLKQRELMIEVLENAVPTPVLLFVIDGPRMLPGCPNSQLAVRTLFPPAYKISREYYAAFTTLFCAWLIGPCELRESEVNGRREKNIVHIPKCRFLEESNCVGTCINLCKMPSQEFIKNSFGMPVNMVPNFEDMSCQMIFGEEPPSPILDPAMKQPCYKQCKSRKVHSLDCSS